LKHLSFKKTPKRIIIRCPNWIGDAVMAAPIIDKIRNAFPKAHITGMLKKNTAQVFSGSSWFDEFLYLDKPSEKNKGSKINSFFNNVGNIKKGSYDFAVLLTNSFESAFMMFLAGVKYRIGYKRDGRSCFLTAGLEPKKENGRIVPVPMIDYYNNIGSIIDLNDIPRKTKLFLSEDDKKEAELILKKLDITDVDTIIGLNPGAAFGVSKCWLPEYYAEVGDYFAGKPGNKVVVFFGPGEERIADEVKSLMKNKCHLYTDKIISLGALKVLINKCSLLVTNDSGPRHFALAFDIPTVTIMGPIEANLTANEFEHEIIVRNVPSCGPCHLRECPYNHQCMKCVKPQAVIQSSETLLQKSKKIKDVIYGSK